MTDLERLFSLVVTNVAALDRARLNQAIPVGDLLRNIIPYRTSRRALGVLTNDEYEHLLLRFVAGEGGFARSAPEESRARFSAEARTHNPDLAVLTADPGAVVWLTADKVALALDGGERERGYAPPAAPIAAPVEAPAPEAASGPGGSAEPEFEIELEPTPRPASEQCTLCGGGLPTDRVVHFCPYCGHHFDALRCPRCHSEVEPEWRHCIT